ncbi:MAG: HlyD family efflux transporter periplasmic adaptor subunit [Sphingobacteriia bacterium]|nr:HlyD family efflux transporter periplasmic adaptor subunit [Sphingobacteriia bacterium]
MKKLLIVIASAIVVIIIVWYFMQGDNTTVQSIKVPVRYGQFLIDVSTAGELEAKNSENIYGPENLRSIQIWSDIRINQLIPEGTIVDSGDFVASLDQTEVMSRLKDLETELEKLESQYTKTLLDTSLNMRAARNELVNLEFSLEEQQIKVEQSIYEPPAVQRQEAINLEKARRAYNQAVENYTLRLEKSKAEMQEVSATLEQAQRRRQRMVDVLKQFTVYAPKPGMIIYRRDWRGQKTETGSTISSWDNVVALLPDLSSMISKTYVNEIDISKVRTGQPVKITIDAFPEREFSGIVSEVANIGEQRPGSDAKVFEVIITVNESDTIMRPAMTTKNVIITAQIDSVFSIPIEALHSNDSLSYVFMDAGVRIIKKQVIPGQANNSEIIISEGLKQGEEVILTIPENHADLKLIMLNE